MTNFYTMLLPLAGEIHRENVRWWRDLTTGFSILASRDRLSLLMLVVTEVSEYQDGLETGEFDQHLPEWKNSDIELGDVVIRLLDMIGAEDKLHGELMRETPISADRCDVRHLVAVLSFSAEMHRKGHTELYRAGLLTALRIVCGIAERDGVNLLGAIAAKRAFNMQRADHSNEHRRAAGGKKQ